MERDAVIFFAGWLPIVRVLVVGTLGYFFLLFGLRTVGPRTLAKTNMFDFIVMVSIGSVFGRILTASDVSLVEACVAYALLMVLHYGVSWTRVRSPSLASMLDAGPTLLFYGGTFIEGAMRKHRVIRADLEAAVRTRGIACVGDVAAIVLEPDGGLSIIGKGGSCQELLPGA